MSRSFRYKYDKELYRCIEILHRIIYTVSDYEKIPTMPLTEEKKLVVEKDLPDVLSIIQFATDFLDNNKEKMTEAQIEDERIFIADLQNAYVKLKGMWSDQLLRQG